LFVFTLVAILFAALIYMYRRGEVSPPPALPAMSDEQIKQAWRKLGFFCEIDTLKRQWRLTGSRAGLLYFPDLLLGFINDPKNAKDGEKEHFGPYGSLEIMMWPDAGFDSHAIRGSAASLAHLAELIEVKLATAEPGLPITIREEYSADSPYSLLLDVRADGFDPAAADREQLGAATEPKKPPEKKP
jgi:hypothetical protein